MMIFGIHSSILDNLNENSPHFDRIIELLDILAISIKHKKHLLCLSRIELSKIISIENNLSSTAIRVYRYLSSHFISSPKGFDKKVVITLDNDFIILNESTYHVPLRVALERNFFDINFVTEDLNDKKFYFYIASSYYKKHFHSVPYFYCNFKNGGGSRCSSIIEDCYSSNPITISILDSDKKFPDCQLGGTARNVFSLNIPNLSTSIVDIIYTDVREAENLIPIFFYKTHMKSCFDPQIEVLKSLNHDYLNYFDFKEGLTKHKLENNSSKHEFWKPVIRNTFSYSEPYPNILIKGFGDSTLTGFLNFLNPDYVSFHIRECERVTPTNDGIQNRITTLKLLQNFISNPYLHLEDRLEMHWNSIGNSLSRWLIGYPTFIS